MHTITLIVALAFLTLSSGIVLAQEAGTNQAILVSQGNIPSNAIEVGNKICPVSNEQVPGPGVKSDMGDKPIKIFYKGKIYNLCCPMCIKNFKKDPEKYSAIAEKEVSGQK